MGRGTFYFLRKTEPQGVMGLGQYKGDKLKTTGRGSLYKLVLFALHTYREGSENWGKSWLHTQVVQCVQQHKPSQG